jgi:hypothetical protein
MRRAIRQARLGMYVPFMAYQYDVLSVCSRRRHHIAKAGEGNEYYIVRGEISVVLSPVIVTNDGATVASKIPKKNRAASSLEKLREEAMALRTMP